MRSARREEIVARLIPAVEQLLRDGATYSDLSVSRIIEDAGTSRTRFYVYFEDKGDLLRALADDVVAELFAVTMGWWSLTAGQSAADLRVVTERIVTAYLDHRHVMAAVTQVASHDSATREHYGAIIGAALDNYAAELASGQARGDIDPALEPPATVELLSTMTRAGLYQLVATGSARRAEPWIDALNTIVWSTLYAPTRDAADVA